MSAEGRTLNILLVEDDDGDALLVHEELEDARAQVRLLRARTLAEALSLCTSGVDCALLDLGLPDAGGLQALERIQAAAPRLAVVVLTGLNDETAGAAAVRAGAEDYLVKGQASAEVLVRAIRYAIARRQAETARRELEIADLQARESARLERGLLPTPILSDARLRVTSCSRPGRRRALLGGDFFDVVETPDGVVHVLIGDVCGNGPDEAALGVSLRSAWRALVLSGADPGVVISTLHRIVAAERHLPSLFATLCTLQMSAGRDRLRMHRAGHMAPLLLEGDRIVALPDEPAGPPIGVVDHTWPAVEVALPERWSLLLYTDGLTEARIAGGDPLGDAGLVDLLVRHRAEGPGGLHLPAIIESVEALHGGPLGDDVALVLLESHGGPGDPR